MPLSACGGGVSLGFSTNDVLGVLFWGAATRQMIHTAQPLRTCTAQHRLFWRFSFLSHSRTGRAHFQCCWWISFIMFHSYSLLADCWQWLPIPLVRSQIRKGEVADRSFPNFVCTSNVIEPSIMLNVLGNQTHSCLGMTCLPKTQK